MPAHIEIPKDIYDVPEGFVITKNVQKHRLKSGDIKEYDVYVYRKVIRKRKITNDDFNAFIKNVKEGMTYKQAAEKVKISPLRCLHMAVDMLCQMTNLEKTA